MFLQKMDDMEFKQDWRGPKIVSFTESMRIHNVEVLDERPLNKACTPVEILCEQFNTINRLLSLRSRTATLQKPLSFQSLRWFCMLQTTVIGPGFPFLSHHIWPIFQRLCLSALSKLFCVKACWVLPQHLRSIWEFLLLPIIPTFVPDRSLLTEPLIVAIFQAWCWLNYTCFCRKRNFGCCTCNMSWQRWLRHTFQEPTLNGLSSREVSLNKTHSHTQKASFLSVTSLWELFNSRQVPRATQEAWDWYVLTHISGKF